MPKLDTSLLIDIRSSLKAIERRLDVLIDLLRELGQTDAKEDEDT